MNGYSNQLSDGPPDPNSGVVTGTGKAKRSFKIKLNPANKKRILITSTAVFVIALVSFLVFRPEEKPAVIVDTDNLADAAHQLEASGNFRQAIEVYDEAVSQASGEQKADLLTTQATIAFRNKATEDAQGYIKRAVDEYPTPENLSLAGAISKQLGDKEGAIDYYKRALEAFQSQKIREEPEEQAIQKIIDELESSP